eukprot:RCo004729
MDSPTFDFFPSLMLALLLWTLLGTSLASAPPFRLRVDPVHPYRMIPRPPRTRVAVSLLVGHTSHFLARMLPSLVRSDLMDGAHDVVLFAWVNFPGSDADLLLRSFEMPVPLVLLGNGQNLGITVP